MTDNKELIEKYFENQLTKEDLLVFEHLIKTDADFQADFNFEKQLKTALTLNERIDLKQLLIGIEDNKVKSIGKSFPYKWLGVAATIIIAFGAMMLLINNKPSDEKLYLSFFESYPNTVSPTVRGEVTSNLISIAFYHYDNENYEEAIKLFDEIYKTELSDYALFYKGLSQMELQKINDAIITFKTFDFSSKSEYNEKISWYLALCYIKSEQKEKAIPLLKNITNSDNQFKKSASELLDLLK